MPEPGPKRIGNIILCYYHTMSLLHALHHDITLDPPSTVSPELDLTPATPAENIPDMQISA